MCSNKGVSIIETVVVVAVVLVIAGGSVGLMTAEQFRIRALENQFSVLLTDIRWMQQRAVQRGVVQRLILNGSVASSYSLYTEDGKLLAKRRLPAGMTIIGDKLRDNKMEFYPTGIVGPQAGGLILKMGLSSCSVYVVIGSGALNVSRKYG